MNRIPPPDAADLSADIRAILAESDQFMGFAATDIRVMAKWPELLQAMSAVVGTVYGPGEIDEPLKRLLSHVASTAAGCRYCAAHTAHGALETGTAADKLAAVWEFETSPLFSPAERAALRIARGGGSHPNAVTDADFAELREHFSERGALEIVAVIALFGFLNRWNDTLATALEDAPLNATRDVFGADWDAGKHG